MNDQQIEQEIQTKGLTAPPGAVRMSFRRYESRPITRLAHEITEADRILPAGTNLLRLITPEGEEHTFVHYDEVHNGDFIVYLNEDDIYHCSRAVFLERNVVPDAPEEQEEGVPA